MKKKLNKLAKGMFAIFTIKLLFLGIMFLNQSCQSEDSGIYENESEKLALQKLEDTFFEIQPQINKIVENKYFFSQKSSSPNKELISETKKALMPLINSSKELLKHYGIEDKDLSEEFQKLDDPRIAFVGIMLLSAKKKLLEIILFRLIMQVF